MDEAAEKSRRLEANFKRRKRRHDQEEVALAAQEALKAAQEQGKELTRKAQKQARETSRKTIEDAKTEAERMANSIIASAKEKEKLMYLSIDTALEALAAKEKAFETLWTSCDWHPGQGGDGGTSAVLEPASTPDVDRDLRREKDRERQRKCYWKKKADKALVAQSPAESQQQALPRTRSIRTHRRVAKRMVQAFHAETKPYNEECRKQILKSFWMHPSLKDLHPAGFGAPKIDLAVKKSIEATRRALQVVKGAQRKDYLAAKSNILVAFAGKEVVAKRYLSSVAKALTLNRSNLYRAAKQRAALDADKTAKFSLGQRKVRSDRLSEAVRDFVQDYWENNTRVSPQKRDECRKRHGRLLYEYHQMHWLEETQAEFYLKFVEGCEASGMEIPVGFRMFQYLKPFYVRVLKDRNVCCCKYHVEMELLKEGLNKFRLFSHPHETCRCNCEVCRISSDGPTMCSAGKATIKSVREWCEQTMCPKVQYTDELAWHDKKCIEGKCESCKVANVKSCSTEVDKDEGLLINWSALEVVTVETGRKRKNGDDMDGPKKRVRQVERTTTMDEFLTVVRQKMKYFVMHNFHYRWQAEQYKRCLNVFPKGTVVSSIDFSENYTFTIQDEVQSMHWDNQQLSILVHATWRHDENATLTFDPDTGIPIREIISDYHFYISDDRQHDTLFVQHCLDLHAKWMAKNKIECKRHWVWSDGCAAQFKSRRPFYFVSRYYKSYGSQMQWNFHATGHGKNVVDGEGGSQKSAMSKEQLKGREGHQLRNAHDAVQFLKARFALGKETEYGYAQSIRRHYWEIKPEDVNRRKAWDCGPVTDCRSKHCFNGFSKTNACLLKVRELSCFCDACVDDNERNCCNKHHAGESKLVTIQPKVAIDAIDAIEVQSDEDDGEEVDDDGTLAEQIEEGDYFSVLAHADDQFRCEFYILQCTRALHVCTDTFTDEWKTLVEKGDEVLEGIWFQQIGRQSTRFVWNKTAPKSFVHAEAVTHYGFQLRPTHTDAKGDQFFTLSADTLETITGSLPSLPAGGGF